MVSAKFMKGAQAPNVMDDNINDAANYDANDAVNDDADELWERDMDGADDQMEQIEKMMRPLTQVHPAAIIAGTIIAGAIVVILVFRLMQKNNEMRQRMESKRLSQIQDEDQILNGAFSGNSVDLTTDLTTTASVEDSELSLTESAAEEVEERGDGPSKLEEDAKAAEAARIAQEQLKAAEIARIAEDEAIARIAEEQHKAAEAARTAEGEAIAAETARLAEEEAKATAKLVEEATALLEEEAKTAATAEISEEAETAEVLIKSEEKKEEAAAAAAAEIVEDRMEHPVTATPVTDESIKAKVAKTSEVEPTALLKADKDNSSSNESFEHLEPDEVEEPVSADGNMTVTKEAPTQDAMAWLRELAEEIPREENGKDETKDEGENSTLTVSLAQNDEAIQPAGKRVISKIEAKEADETVADETVADETVVDNVIVVASKEELSVMEKHPVALAECDDVDDDDEDATLESDGADFRNVNVKEMKECLVATSDDEKESRV